MPPPIAVSLVIPAYNEESRLPSSLRDIRAFFGHEMQGLEVLVVVEASSDRSLDAAREAVHGDARFQIVDNLVHRGKGYAVKSGMLRAQGEIVIFMDADLSTPLAEVYAFLAHLVQHPETHVAIGSREHARSQIMRKQTWIRRNLGRTFNAFVQGLTMRGITDTQCGFKAFRRDAAQDLFSRQTLDGFAFDVEILMLARELGYKIDVLPVKWVNSPASKVRIWIDPLKMLWDLLKIRRRVRRSVRARPRAPSIPASR
ncbi:MAG: glycosyltransferase family 2 protein [Bdellovibrionaceae bacterium]|nr:glycosyltransferase family 2 protein [Pseudobdellovibrionaceae bacterium]